MQSEDNNHNVITEEEAGKTNIKKPSQINHVEDDDYDDDDYEDEDSVLEEIENEDAYFKKKLIYQNRALFRKNLTLQWRQKWTNVWQLMSPVMGLLIVVLFRTLGVTVLLKFADKAVSVPFPQLFGLNMHSLGTLSGGIIQAFTCDQWYMFEFDQGVSQADKDFFGYNEGKGWPKLDSAGMLNGHKNIQSYACNQINKTVPYFKQYSPTKYNFTDMNLYLSDVLTIFSKSNIDFNDRSASFPELDLLPDGAFIVKEANKKKLRYNLQVNDLKYWQYHRYNGITKIGLYDKEDGYTYKILRTVEGALVISDIINQAYMRELFNDTNVIGGVNFYPFKADFNNQIQKGLSLVAFMVFPLCMSMGLPVFLYQIVLEKETRLIENMKINGMQMKTYWKINYLFNLVFYMLTAMIFLLFGITAFDLQIFTDTNFFVLLTTLFGWGLAQISMAFFISVFVSKSQTASIVGYTVAVWFTTVASVFNITIYSAPAQMDSFLMVLPTFTFSRLIYWISCKCGNEHCLKGFYEFNSEMKWCFFMLYFMAAVYLLLALYLYEVVPQTYGVPKKWDFLWNKKGKKIGDQAANSDTNEEEVEGQSDQPVSDYDMSLEDADSKAERNIVYNLNEDEYYKYPLVIKDMRKIYPACGGVPPKVATKCFSLRIKKGEMFGMLGPNGAGKTTLISMLTGMYRPTAGNAWVAGFSIKDQLEVVQLQIGVCPQFDLLWSDLTVEEHLLFFARLKGIEPEIEQEKVDTAIAEVLLQKFRHFPVKNLSGGMKRRLSVAISLVSDPKIIYLDEPSTGLDPENRRQLWDILSAQKGKRAIILTTHSMEEADVLCNRIGIVAEGILRCVAPQVRLKSIYGGGYHLFINCQKGKVLQLLRRIKRRKQREMDKKKNGQLMSGFVEENKHESDEDKANSDDEAEVDDDATIIQNVAQFIKVELPSAILIREFNGNFVYQIPLEGFKAEKFYQTMEKNRQRLRITDWGLSQCSLEDVFSRICEPK